MWNEGRQIDRSGGHEIGKSAALGLVPMVVKNDRRLQVATLHCFGIQTISSPTPVKILPHKDVRLPSEKQIVNRRTALQSNRKNRLNGKYAPLEGYSPEQPKESSVKKTNRRIRRCALRKMPKNWRRRILPLTVKLPSGIKPTLLSFLSTINLRSVGVLSPTVVKLPFGGLPS